MANANEPGQPVPTGFIRFHHGTDLASATDLLVNGVSQQHAAAWNGSGEFWATTDHDRAEWFALSHPNSPPAACYEFDLPESVLLAMLNSTPPTVRNPLPGDFEFLPTGFGLLNQHMTNRRMLPLL